MKTLNYVLFASLLIVLGCSDSTIVDPVNPDNNINSILNKNSNAEMIKVFPAMKPITIDGLENEWARAPKHKMRLEVDAGSPIENKDDLTSYFKMLWDEDNLYVFARIQDEDINVSGAELYEKDGLEIYIDGGNYKRVGANDFPPPNFTPAAYEDDVDFFRFIPGETSALSAYGIIDASSFEFAITETSNGYNVEVRMPFADLPDFPAEAGHAFGVEFQTNDNDNGERQNFLKWNSALDESYFNPGLFGTAVLFKN